MAGFSAKRGEAGIVIATRSGIFTPLYAPGIIIIDEEHDLSYKQQDSIRYSARDVALYRGRLENIPVVLGTATPSMETLYNSTAQQGLHYRYQRLQSRAGGAVPPKLMLVDTRHQPLEGGLTPESLNAIRQTLTTDIRYWCFSTGVVMHPPSSVTSAAGCWSVRTAMPT